MPVSKAEIIRQAKRYFGKDRTFIKERILSYEFNGKEYKHWKQEIKRCISNPNEIYYNIFDDVVVWIKENKPRQIDWNWIGDLSWTIDIVLNPGISSTYDMDKKLALACGGTARILTLFISDVIPCYTYDLRYMTFDKSQDFYEFGPLLSLTANEKKVLKNLNTLLKNKGFEFADKNFCAKRFKELRSDTNQDGNASLFDVLFTDTYSYTTEIKRFCNKEIIEKNGQKFRWTEYYTRNKILRERVESRWTSAGDHLKVVLNGRGEITSVEVTRKKINRKHYQNFKLDISKAFHKQQRNKPGKNSA